MRACWITLHQERLRPSDMNRKPKRKAIGRQRLGRPKLPEPERRGPHIPVRLTPAEKAEFTAAADACGMRLGAWLREAGKEKLAREKAEQDGD